MLRLLFPLLSVLLVGTCFGQGYSEAATAARAAIREAELHGYGRGAPAQRQAAPVFPAAVPLYVPVQARNYRADRLELEVDKLRREIDILQRNRENFSGSVREAGQWKLYAMELERDIRNLKNSLGAVNSSQPKLIKLPMTKEEYEAGVDEMKERMMTKPTVQNIQDYIEWELSQTRQATPKFFVVKRVDGNDIIQ